MLPVVLALIITIYFFMTNILNFIYFLVPYYAILFISVIISIPALLLADRSITGCRIIRFYLKYIFNLICNLIKHTIK